MPKSNFTTKSHWLDALRYLSIIFLFLWMTQAMGQGQSLGCHGALQISLDVNCEAEISGLTVLSGESPTDKAGDFIVTITEKNTGHVPGSIYSGSGAGLTFSNTNFGEYIRFTEPGDFIVSVKRKSSGVNCWGYLYVENKLLLEPENCACPDTATVIGDSCRFSCVSIDVIFQNGKVTEASGLNPAFTTQCINGEKPTFTDELLEDTICGNWYILRTWKAKVINSHGSAVKEYKCKQKFLFDAIEASDIHPPKAKVIVDCRVSTHPDSILAYFSNTKLFPDLNKDDAVACAYPYIIDSIPGNEIIIPARDSAGICGTERDSMIKILQWYSESQQQLFSTEEACNAEDCELIWILSNVVIEEEEECIFTLSEGDTIRTNRFPIGGHLKKGSIADRCKVTATYKDSPKIVICGPDNAPTSYKFVRNWYIINWCTNEATDDIYQIIKVIDTLPPSYTVPDSLPLVSTDPWTCVRNVGVPPPMNLKDNCTPVNRLTWTARIYDDYGYIEANAANNYIFQGLEVGEYTVVYEVADDCDNSFKRTTKLKIIDRASPIVITKSTIAVTFSEFEGNCTAKIFAHNIDIGSHDACDGNMVERKIKRLGDATYADFVKFSESDITGINDFGVPYGEVKVELKVTDKSGNYSIGWTNVRLEDKSSQIIISCGDKDIFLDCRDDLTEAIETYKPSVLLKACDNRQLNVSHLITKNDLNPKCNTGSVYVQYQLGGDSICSKRFILGDIDTTRIIWPQEEIEATCSDTDFGAPVIQDEYCSLLSTSLETKEFGFPEGTGYCKKIVRSFTIIDWCLYKINSNHDTSGIYHFNQVIKIKDDVKPEITCIFEQFTAGPDCGLKDFKVSTSAVDEGDCASASLYWEARLDIDGDGFFEYELSPQIDPVTGNAMAIIDTLLSNGQYDVRWKATDECGNSDVEVCSFSIVDDKAPTPVCISNISTALMNTSGRVTIWAQDFDPTGKSYDSCDGILKYSFSGISPDEASITFDCFDIPNGINHIVELPLYVWDESGNRDFCIVRVRLDDNANVCTDIADGAAVITGSIRTESGETVESAEVEVFSFGQNYLDHKMTSVGGEYAFMETPMDYDYVVSATKNDDFLNGVTTLDLLLIQRHILNIQSLPSAYKVIAADINDDERITAIDLVELRGVILGIRDEFVNNTSWRFIDAAQTFNDILDPWPIREEIDIFDLPSHATEMNFIAVKVGDVNGTAIANSQLAGGRSLEKLELAGQDRVLQAGEKTLIRLKLSGEEDMYGLQLELGVHNADLLSFFSNVVVKHDQYVMAHDGLKLSWTSPANNPVKELVLSLEVMAHTSTKVSEIVRLLADEIRGEVYIGKELTTRSIVLSLQESDKIGMVFDLLQNKPNPFSEETVIGFTLPEEGPAEIRVYDMTGREIYELNDVFPAGKSEIFLKKELLTTSGVLYYQLSFQGNIATRKMISIE